MMIYMFRSYILIAFFLCINCSNPYKNIEDLILEEYPFEFPNSTSSPVNKQTEDIISTTIDYNWNLTFSYTYVKNVLNLSIISDSHRSPYKHYVIELRIKDSLNLLEKVKVTAIQPKTTVTFRNVQPYTENTFTIIPYTRNGSADIIDKTMYLGGYKLDSLDCNLPYSKLKKVSNMKEKSMQVEILSENDKSCFQKYEFSLTKKLLHNNKCPDNYEILDQKTVTFDVRMFVTFKNLTFGNYCVAYEGIHEYCPNMKCLLSSSILESFKETDYQDVITPLPSIQVSPLSDYLVPLIVSMIASIILITILFLIWKGVIHYRIIFHVLHVIKNSKEETKDDPKEDIENKSHKQLIIPILYAQDCEIQNEVAVALYNFIKECFDVKPIIDVEDIGCINKGDVAWIENLVDYKCSKRTAHNKMENNKKLIILETECALKLYHSWKNQQILYYKKYSFLNEFFRRGLGHLLSNIQIHKMDYCHLFVLRFAYSPSEKLDIVPKKRFLLPDCLVELYNSIHNEQTDVTDQQTEALLQEWKKKDSFKDLTLAIKKMEEYVAVNPNYVDDLFLSNINDLKEVYVV